MKIWLWNTLLFIKLLQIAKNKLNETTYKKIIAQSVRERCIALLGCFLISEKLLSNMVIVFPLAIVVNVILRDVIMPLRIQFTGWLPSMLFQCQSQLKTLYAEGIEGCHMEFSAYNLLCVILHSNNYRDLLSSMSRLVNLQNDNLLLFVYHCAWSSLRFCYFVFL